ncbi:MAG: hypothetical protein UV73_C0001G0005 [Candidatus Gottesmanbacteria bacterium GW2011_GWA2_43_14]|uniref:Phosphoribosylformylglycinamidine cyclo-ligase n=1 Tax=Candidatus Gottesmanbacteria bacterium GW2011_GWA2_43_14 TaxID=1618443 RepID=A0A0G1DLE1_9BACT|nr:MAG: hypothetical protein UV73_C0001G0005 [Candidatus Gottesmanbacteria bacterium GW2011_GWA2_43_14]
MKKVTYRESGVVYQLIDPFKIMAQVEGRKTAKNLKFSRMREVGSSRGESAYVIEYTDCYFALVEECLGTKSLVADEMGKLSGRGYYGQIAQDTVAYIINDLITVGAQPASLVAYWAAGSSRWFGDKKRTADFIKGWVRACNQARVSWGGGETPVLNGIVKEGAIDLAGACFGIIKPKKRLVLGKKLQADDAIILLESKGIQSNGVSLARKISKKLPDGYLTKMSDGNYYGEGLLVPTIIYSSLIQALFASGIDIHYLANITGHGWRKIMRSEKHFTYRINSLPPVPEVFNFIMANGPVDKKEAYGSFNMGAGFAVFVASKDVKRVIAIAAKNDIKAYFAGSVEKGKKQVVIAPLNIIYDSRSLQVKA